MSSVNEKGNKIDLAGVANMASQMHNDIHEDQIEEKALDLCNRYISGVWSELKVEDIDVKRLTGGIGSQLYWCRRRKLDDNSGVVLKLNDSSSPVWNTKFNRAIIAQVLSANGVGPKVYGVFDGGMIMQYHKVYTFMAIKF